MTISKVGQASVADVLAAAGALTSAAAALTSAASAFTPKKIPLVNLTPEKTSKKKNKKNKTKVQI